MTSNEILAMEPGRELDALVAEKVMGWTNFREKWDEIVPEEIPHYSADISAAWEVVEKFKYLYLFREENLYNGQHECKLIWISGREFYAISPTAPEAICKAALLAVMEEQK